MRSRRLPRVRVASVLGCCLLAGLTGQAGSPDFVITEQVFNAGGQPADGQILTSASWSISLGAIGEAVSAVVLCNTGFCVESGFVTALAPPGSVRNLQFTLPDRIEWDPVAFADSYDLYRGDLVDLPGAYGVCLAGDLPATTATVFEDPAAGRTFFYLATASNPIGGEGNKSTDSTGKARPNPAPCS